MSSSDDPQAPEEKPVDDENGLQSAPQDNVPVSQPAGTELIAHPPEPPQSPDLDIHYKQGLFFFIIWLSASFIVSMGYAAAHGINILKLFSNTPQVIQANFLGGSKNAFSIMFETTFWSFLGVSCRVAYDAVKAILASKFSIFRFLAIWLGTVGFAWGVSTALVFSLTIISVKVGTADLTFAEADIQTIAAFAFIIGYFNDKAIKLLESVQDRFAQVFTKSQQPDASGASNRKDQN